MKVLPPDICVCLTTFLNVAPLLASTRNTQLNNAILVIYDGSYQFKGVTPTLSYALSVNGSYN